MIRLRPVKPVLVATLVIAFFAVLTARTAHSQSEPVQVKRPSELRQQPSDTSPSVATLPAQTNITRLPERQGPWMHVKTDAGQVGWVHMFDIGTVQAQSTAANTASGALRGLTNFFNRGTTQTTTTATSTVGIRGLGSEEIANAQPNLEALRQAEGMRADEPQARRFAGDAKLAARNVDPLPVPSSPTAPAQGDGPGGFKQGGK